MKKSIIGLLLTLALSITLVGCRVTDEQVKVIAQNAGLASVVTWIAYDDPDNEAKQILSEALDVVQSNAVRVTTGSTYMEVIYPEVFVFVNTDEFDARYRPIVLAGSLSALNGIDILFAANPEWKEKADLSLDVVNSFINGAKMGLALSDQDTVIMTANELTVRREVVRRQFSDQ